MNSMEQKLEAVEKAIMDLQSGKRVTSVQYGDTRVQYAEINLQELIDLRTKIKAAMNTNNHRQVHFSTSKGLK